MTVNSPSPGCTTPNAPAGNHDPDGIPAGVLGRPEDFGTLAVLVSSEHARYLTGTAIHVDGGARTLVCCERHRGEREGRVNPPITAS